MTVVNPKSISGINSITMASGSDDLLTIHSNNTTERVRVNNSGDVIVGSGVTLSPDGDVFATGVCTATSFVGNGSGLTNLATDLVNDTSPQLGGTLDTNGNLITFGDSSSASDDRLKFGASSDLVMYHDGTDNYIAASSGHLNILGDGSNEIHIKGIYNEESIIITPNAGVDLYYNDTKVCETSANGLAFPSGKGIDFSATSDGAGTDSSELLDDYEEGTWTPSIKQGGGSITTNHVSLYTKVGRLVHIQTYLEFDASSANGNQLQIQGLPYIVAANNYEAQVVDFGAGGKKGAYSRTDPGAYYVTFLYSSESTGSGRITLKGNQVGSGYIIFSNTYMTS